MWKRYCRAFLIGVAIGGILLLLTLPPMNCAIMERYDGFCETVRRIAIPKWIEWIFVIPATVFLFAAGAVFSVVGRVLGNIPAVFGWIWYISLGFSILLSLVCFGLVSVFLAHVPSWINRYWDAFTGPDEPSVPIDKT